MKLFKRTVIWLSIVLILVCIGLSSLIEHRGKTILSSLDKSLTLEDVSYRFPMGLRATNVQFDDVLKASEIRAQLSLASLFTQSPNFSSVVLVKPNVNIKKEELEERFTTSAGQADSFDAGASTAEGAKREKRRVNIKIGRLKIKDGNVNYTDSGSDDKYSFKLNNVQFKAKRLSFPVNPAKSDFSFLAQLAKEGSPLSGSRVEGSGWVDMAKKDMIGSFEVVDDQGKTGLTAQAVCNNNDMVIHGDMQLNNILSGPKKNGSDKGSANQLVFGSFPNMSADFGIQYSYRTKMDNPFVGEFSGNIVPK